MEAAAMETPIITTDNVGCREVVDHNKNGFIIPTKNVQSLVEAIEEFISMEPQDRMVMGKLGRKKVLREFDEKIILKEYEKTIGRVLNIETPSVITTKKAKVLN